ncbi:MAG: response regulator [Pacificimonas sp.]
MPLRVLIAEDEFLIAMDLECQVEDAGHIVVGIAATKDKAIALAIDQRPDFAFMDLQLAGPSSGIEAAKQLRRQLGIGSVLLSGSLHKLTDSDIREIGPLAMLSKPVLGTQVQSELGRLSDLETD